MDSLTIIYFAALAFTAYVTAEDESFDTAICRRQNTHTLPNGAVIDNYNKLCACRAKGKELFQLIKKGYMDIEVPSCNADGTFECYRRHVMMMPREVCVDNEGNINTHPEAKPDRYGGMSPCKKGGYCKPACMKYEASSGWKNVGGCTCNEASDQEFSQTATVATKYVPQCKADKSWENVQRGYNGSWCVDTNGNQVGSFVTSGQPTC